MGIVNRLLGKNASGRYKQFRIRVDPKSPLRDGEYAMWWSAEDAASVPFEETRIYNSINAMYEACRSHEAYLYPDLLYHLGIITGTPPIRLEPPTEETQYILRGPKRKEILLSVSKEKGIRFLFPIQSTSPEYRDSILQFIGREMITAAFIFENHRSISKEADSESFQWFAAAKKAMQQESEEANSVKYFSYLNVKE